MWCNLYNVPHIHRPFDTRFTNLRRQHANQDNLLEIYCFAGYCLPFIDLRLLSTPMRSVVRYHTSIISLFMTYHRMLYNSNMMGATNGQSTALLFRKHHRHEFRQGFSFLRFAQFLVVCVKIIVLLGFCSLAIVLSVLIRLMFLITSLVFSSCT